MVQIHLGAPFSSCFVHGELHMPSQKQFTTSQKDKGTRLDVFLSKKLNISRSQVQKAVKRGCVLVNNEKAGKSGVKLKENDIVILLYCVKQRSCHATLRCYIVEEEKEKGKEIRRLEDYKIKVVEDTDDYLVINKPAGLLTHPTEQKEEISLAAWLLEKYPELESVGEYDDRPGIVHRLDKEASGLLVVAKNQKMFEHLKKQFQKREVEKEYLVLVYGKVEADHDIIDFEIDRGKEGRMAARPKTNRFRLKNVLKIQKGREAITEFWVEERFVRYTLLKVKLHTGRTHQIRVHMLAYNHPVVGDKLYFNKKLIKKSDKELGRLFLHASRLCFEDLKGEKVCFESELTDELVAFLEGLK